MHIGAPAHILLCSIAWVMGAADPTSGTVSLHEVIRGFGELLDNGWKPLRTSTSFHSIYFIASPNTFFVSSLR